MNMRFAFTKLSDYVRITMKTGYKKTAYLLFPYSRRNGGRLEKIKNGNSFIFIIRNDVYFLYKRVCGKRAAVEIGRAHV